MKSLKSSPMPKKVMRTVKIEKVRRTHSKLNEKYGLALDAHHADCARRIRALIKMSTFHQAQFARHVGVSITQINNLVKGVSRPSVDAAIAIIRAMPGTTLDYIYLGNKSGLSMAASQAIIKAEAEIDREEHE